MKRERNRELIKRFRVRLFLDDRTIQDFCREHGISFQVYNDFQRGRTTGERNTKARRLVQAIPSYLAEEDQAA